MTRARTPRLRQALLTGLVLVVVGCLAALGWLYADRTDAADGTVGERIGALVSGDDPAQPTREEVMSQARQFMLRVNTYGPSMLDDQDQMPEYRALVEEVITPTFQQSFEQGVPAAEQTVAAAGVARSAEVFATGVSGLDPDSATVLVAGSFVNSYPADTGRSTGGGKADPEAAERIEDTPAPFRVEVSLVRTDGQWLVDDFEPVTDAEGATP